MKVYQAIAAVMKDMTAEGISKSRKNVQQGYAFRGIDDVYNALAPVLAKHGLVMLPRVLSRICEERQTAKGGTLFYVTVEVEFTLACAEDDSTVTIKTYGEAMDSGDKATNKAMSAAYKYAAMQAFCIPTEGDNDADATTHQVAPQSTSKPKKEHKPADAVNAIKGAETVDAVDKILDAAKRLFSGPDLALVESAAGARVTALKEPAFDDVPY